MSKFSRKPKATQDLESFIVGQVESYHTESHDMEPYPWEKPGVRDDVLKVYNLRLPEPYLLKLKYISEHTPASMHRFCLEVLLPAIDARIERLTKP